MIILSPLNCTLEIVTDLSILWLIYFSNHLIKYRIHQTSYRDQLRRILLCCVLIIRRRAARKYSHGAPTKEHFSLSRARSHLDRMWKSFLCFIAAAKSNRKPNEEEGTRAPLLMAQKKGAAGTHYRPHVCALCAYYHFLQQQQQHASKHFNRRFLPIEQRPFNYSSKRATWQQQQR